MRQSEKGYFLLLAVLFIMVIGVTGSIIANMLGNQAMLSVFQLNGLKAFYLAESGLEIGSRLLTMPVLTGTPSRIACANLTGTAQITNASLAGGTFTVASVNNTPYWGIDTLSGAVTATGTTITVTSVAGFAPAGRIFIDQEAMNYAAISGNSFIGVTRGVNETIASSHASGAFVGQYQCTLDVTAGLPSIASPKYQRELKMSVQLQNGWIVGNAVSTNFIFSQWNHPTEKSWTLTTVAGGTLANTLNDVSMLSTTDGWAVGNVDTNQFLLLRWNGTSWQLNAKSGACTGANLQGVSMVSSIDGWAVGVRYRANNCNSGAQRFNVMRWNGTSWSSLTPTTSPNIPTDNNNNNNLNAVSVIDTNGNGAGDFGFAVGNAGQILRYNGTSWTEITSPTTRNLLGIYIVSAQEAWAVGASGVLIRWNGSTWSVFNSSTTTQLNSIAMFDSNNDGLAEFGIGVGNSGRVIRYNGSTWSSSTFGSNNLSDVDINDPQDAWAVGANGAVGHWDGTSWTSGSAGTTATLNAINLVRSGTDPTSAWQQVFR